MIIDKEFIAKLEELLSNYPPFKDYKLKIDVLQKQKKEEYWGTSVLRYVSDGIDKLNTEGTIYLNFRDAGDVKDILKQVNHEGNHLLGWDVKDTKILEMLKAKLVEGR